MKFFRNLFVFLFLALASVFLFKKFSQKHECNTIVTLETGEKIKCQWVSSYNSGFTNIHTCDNEDVQVYTNNIKLISSK